MGEEPEEILSEETGDEWSEDITDTDEGDLPVEETHGGFDE